MQGIIAALIAGSCSIIGAIPILLFKKISNKTLDLFMGFAGGVMIFAAAFQLIQPAMEKKQYTTIILGLIIGTIILTIIERTVPHSHNKECKESDDDPIKIKLILFTSTMIIHSIPEGFAIGTGYAAGRKDLGIGLALAIGIQNIPEGIIFCQYLKELGISKLKILLWSFFSSLGEPISAAIGVLLIRLVNNYLNLILSIAAASILYVVSHELIPDSHCRGNEIYATYGFIGGFILMIIFKMIIK